MVMPPVLLPLTDRADRPWKNGGGITQDIVLFPPGSGLDDFGWRLSIAVVKSDGAFSHFAGVDRYLAILAGKLALEGDSLPPTILTSGGDPVSFAGDRPVHGRIIKGPVRDLNLMVRRSAFAGRLSRITRIDAVAAAGVTVLVAPEGGTIVIDGTEHQLAPLDALLVEPGGHMRCDSELFVAKITSIA